MHYFCSCAIDHINRNLYYGQAVVRANKPHSESVLLHFKDVNMSLRSVGFDMLNCMIHITWLENVFVKAVHFVSHSLTPPYKGWR